MKVLAVVTQLERAGAQTVAAWMERDTPPDVSISTQFLYNKSGSDLFGADRALSATRPRSPSDALRVLTRLRQLMSGSDVTVAHTHYSIAATIVTSWSMRSSPAIVAVHHWPVARYPRVARMLLRLARRTGSLSREVFVSEAVRDIPGGTVIRNPIPDRAPVGSTHAIDILVVARHSYEKGIDVAIAALAMLPGRTLELIGSGPDTDALREQCRRLGVEGRVTFAGSLPNDEVQARMRSSRVLLLPSRWEAMPMVLLEGVAADARMVVSDIAAHDFVIEAGAALAFRNEDPASLAEVLSAPAWGDNELAEGRARLREAQSESAVRLEWMALLRDCAPAKADEIGET